MFYLVTDGGSRGNPGPSACAWGVCNEDGWLFKDAMYLGEGSNNNAEYHALIYGLLTIRHSNIKDITVISDSELMIKQLTGQYKVGSPTLKPLYDQVKQIAKHITITFTHHKRDHPWITEIDSEYNKCLALALSSIL